MATPTYIALATLTLTGTASTVTFASIPSTYRDLVLVMNCSVTSLDDVLCNLNSNTTDASYSRIVAYGTGSATGSVTAIPRSITYYGAPTSGLQSTHILQFLDANATDKHKTYLTRSGRAGNGLDMIATRFASTSVISSIELTPITHSFESGSTFSLYGIEA